MSLFSFVNILLTRNLLHIVMVSKGAVLSKVPPCHLLLRLVLSEAAVCGGLFQIYVSCM